SVKLGSRPRIFCVRAYSSGVRPCSAAICGVTLVSVSIIRRRFVSCRHSERSGWTFLFARSVGVQPRSRRISLPLPRGANFRSKFECVQAREPADFWTEEIPNANSRRDALDRAARKALDHGTENHEAIRRAKPRLNGALRMRHQSDDVALAIAEARNRGQRAIRIRVEIIDGSGAPVRVNVAENNLLVALKFGERRRIAKIVSFHVRDRHFKNLSGARGARERRIYIFDTNMHLPAQKAQPLVAQHRARQQTRFEQNLKSVADAEDQP